MQTAKLQTLSVYLSAISSMSPANIVRLSGGISNLVLIYFSLRAYRTRSFFYARIFSLLCVFETVADIVLWIPNSGKNLQSMASNLVIIFEFAVYNFIFFKILLSRIFKGILLGVALAYIIYLIYYFFTRSFAHGIPIGPQLCTSLLWLIACFVYFKEIFIYRKQEDLLADFTFWLVTGTTFYCASFIVSTLALGYFVTMNMDRSHSAAYIFSGTVFVIVNILYCKAFLCLKKP